MGYKSKKRDYLQAQLPGEDEKVSLGFIRGMSAAESLLEGEIREIIGPYTELVRNLNTIVSTKNQATRDEILKWILENPETINKLNKNIDNLINIVRL